MKAIAGFQEAIKRAEHLLTLYEILCDTRKRKHRTDWAAKFKTLMHWPQSAEIVRIDGKNRSSILIFKKSEKLDRNKFEHTHTSELLRSSIVFSVSALDRYVHDLIIELSGGILNMKEDKVSREFKQINIPVLRSKQALDQLRKTKSSRPIVLIQKAIQDVIHKQFTFQKPDRIEHGGKIVGIKDFWRKIASKMPNNPKEGTVKNRLERIVERRDQIVHEADLERRLRHNKLSARAIKYKDANDTVKWISDFVYAFDKVAH